MAVDDGVHVRPHFVELAVNEALPIKAGGRGRLASLSRSKVMRSRPMYIPRRDRLHLQVAIRIARVTNADMAERVEHAVISEDVVACDQVHRNLGSRSA